MKKTFSLTFLLLLVVPAILAGGCRETSMTNGQLLLVPPKELSPVSYTEIVSSFENHNYNRQALELGVPPLIINRMPEDLNQIPRVADKKDLFYLSLLPMALMLNEEIASQRHQLERLLRQVDNDQPLSPRERESLEELINYYKIKGNPETSIAARKELLKRVDIVPVSLLLAQAANESGYGTSRFAQAANNLFGEWTFTPGTGLVPEGRPEGETYEVRLFATVYDSLKSYLRNINTHWAYNSLRHERARLTALGHKPTGVELAGGLELYSTRRGEYVSEIRAMIRNNDLEDFSATELRNPLPLERYGRPAESALQIAAQ